MSDHTIFSFDNGVRLVHKQVKNSEIVHCGFMLNAGSRDEGPDNNGIAHFIEHTVFKGTRKRKSFQILRRIENVGGELNAYTTREKTCYYASCLKQYADRAVELLSDITFNSIFPEKELEKEKKVVIDEIDMYDDNPEESIYDDFYARLFKDHPLGYNILGSKQTVSSFTRNTVFSFLKEHYQPEQIILSLVGDLSDIQARKLGNRFVAGIALNRIENKERLKAPQIPSFKEKLQKDFAQAHCIIGGNAYSRIDEKRYALSLINNVLGGAGMSSRLNMAVREKHGFTYNIGSNYSAYLDAGVFSVYFACDPKNVGRCEKIIHRELKRLREKSFTPVQLHQAKVQFLGQMAMLVENNSASMQHQARSLLDYGFVHTFKDFMHEVEKVTSAEILSICNEVFAPEKLSTLIYEVEK